MTQFATTNSFFVIESPKFDILLFIYEKFLLQDA